MPDNPDNDKPGSSQPGKDDPLLDALGSLDDIIETERTRLETGTDQPEALEDSIPVLDDRVPLFNATDVDTSAVEPASHESADDDIPVLNECAETVSELSESAPTIEILPTIETLIDELKQVLSHELGDMVKKAVQDAHDTAMKQASIRIESSIRVKIEARIARLLEEIAARHSRSYE